MRGKDLFEKITNIDDEIITKTAHINKKGKPPYIRWIGFAACFAVVVSAVALYSNNNNETVTDPNLPMITLNIDLGGSMGFEGYMANSIEDLVNANPWNENIALPHLPVINNKVIYNERQAIESPDYALMETLLKDTARSLGMETDSLPITNDIPTDEEQTTITEKFDGEVPEGYFNISRLFMEDENYKLTVDTSYTTRVDFKEPVNMLPSEYNFTHHATYDETLKVAEYLKEEYADFIGMENPTINISGGDFNIYAEQSYSISFFESDSDISQSILNYHFNLVIFACNDNGELFIARRYYTDLSDIVGEYPIIDADEATKLLDKGNYITTVPEEFEGEEYIRKVELIYRNSSHEKVFMPYYRFYVELPEYKREDTGLNTYGAYYVPAVEGQYIENMPIWAGDFN